VYVCMRVCVCVCVCVCMCVCVCVVMQSSHTRFHTTHTHTHTHIYISHIHTHTHTQTTYPKLLPQNTAEAKGYDKLLLQRVKCWYKLDDTFLKPKSVFLCEIITPLAHSTYVFVCMCDCVMCACVMCVCVCVYV